MITVERKDSFHLKISRVLQEETSHKLDLFLFVPGELGLNTHVISEDAFYHGAIHVKRTYYSDRHHLPLVMSRLADRGKLDPNQYRLGLSLYAYQYVVALERSTQALLDTAREARRAEKRGEETSARRRGDRARESVDAGGAEENRREGELAEELHERLEELSELTQGILRRLRRQKPGDESLHRYYTNIDNYLSWLTEQSLLALVAHLPRGSGYREIRERLLAICRAESEHRESCEYNSARVTRDPTRMSNKMRLLRRLIEYPVTLKQRNQELGGGEEKAVKGLATAVVMVFVSLGLLQARDALGDITVLLVLVMAVLYALREVFKDDLRVTLWRWLRKGRPKWRRQYLDPSSNAPVGRQLEWFDYKRFTRLDADVQRVRKRNVAQREEVVLHYRSSSRMSPTRFLSGYDRTRETLSLDLSLLARLMDKGSHHVYRLKEGQVSREAVEKRHLINLVIRDLEGGREPTLQRWKIVMSRSKIVDVELVHEEGDER
ncbi:hypothetical protein [Halomonas heilongjiangensis]|uniref:Uncharacterized protein n=1 Tax=Halomonas heilongjiangensis TaxID=1387883 RepID=A0A2N7TMK9_9GAMM|nr:hypothetical protein [Halomonas heilongjiangensis]PMR69424.1 hypothetical protein C1H66_10515 [Halomonas heilongjiangensis]PXX89895.1 hypothetical protein CR158_09870 [Halomonas heilongjiangensis]